MKERSYNTMRYMLRFIKGSTFFYLVASILRGAFSFLENVFTGQLYAAITNLNTGGIPTRNILILFSLLIFLLLSTYVGEVLYVYAVSSSDKRVRLELSRKLIRMPLGQWYKRHFADWLTVVGKDTDAATNVYKNELQILLQLLIQIIAGSIFLFSNNIWMAIFALGAGFIYTGIGLIRRKSMRSASVERMKHRGEVTSQISNLIEGGVIIRFYHVGEVLKDKLNDSIEQNFYFGKKISKIKIIDGALGQLGYLLAYGGSIMFGLFLVSIDNINLPDMLALWPTSVGISWALHRIGFFATSYQETAAAVDRIKSIEELPYEEGGTKENKKPVEPCISLKNVEFSYDGINKVLSDVSLEIFSGEKVAFVGESGSGKSTLVKLLMNFYPVDSGEITVYGNNVQDYTLPALRSNFSYVPQTVHLFSDSLLENIKMTRPEADENAIISACKEAYAYDFIEDLSDGIQTVVGKEGFQLSGGQARRIGVARAFLHNAPIYIFDEISAGLDDDSEMKINEAIRNVSADKTVLIITHRLSTVQFADKIVVMKDGRIEQIGNHYELLQEKGLYQSLYQSQY